MPESDKGTLVALLDDRLLVDVFETLLKFTGFGEGPDIDMTSLGVVRDDVEESRMDNSAEFPLSAQKLLEI